jgi:hypothetical protein
MRYSNGACRTEILVRHLFYRPVTGVSQHEPEGQIAISLNSRRSNQVSQDSSQMGRHVCRGCQFLYWLGICSTGQRLGVTQHEPERQIAISLNSRRSNEVTQDSSQMGLHVCPLFSFIRFAYEQEIIWSGCQFLIKLAMPNDETSQQCLIFEPPVLNFLNK